MLYLTDMGYLEQKTQGENQITGDFYEEDELCGSVTTGDDSKWVIGKAMGAMPRCSHSPGAALLPHEGLVFPSHTTSPPAPNMGSVHPGFQHKPGQDGTRFESLCCEGAVLGWVPSCCQIPGTEHPSPPFF